MKPISNKLYDWMKWIVMVFLPAITVAYCGFDNLFKWGYGDIVAKASAIVCTLLGTLLGISTAQYNKGQGQEEEANIGD